MPTPTFPSLILGVSATEIRSNYHQQDRVHQISPALYSAAHTTTTALLTSWRTSNSPSLCSGQQRHASHGKPGNSDVMRRMADVTYEAAVHEDTFRKSPHTSIPSLCSCSKNIRQAEQSRHCHPHHPRLPSQSHRSAIMS